MKRNKQNLHLAVNDDGLYFWDRISREMLQKCCFCLIVAMVCVPVFVSMTVRPWIYMLRGETGVRYCNIITISEYWTAVVYILSIFFTGLVAVGMLQRYGHTPPAVFFSGKWISSHWLCVNLLAMLLWSIVSVCFAADKNLALWGAHLCREGLIMYFFYAAFFLGGSWMNEKQVKIIAEVLTGICAFTGILIISGGEVIPGLFYLENTEALMFHNRNHYGYFLAVCAPLAMGLCFQDEKQSFLCRVGRILELWLILNAMSVNSTRGAFIAVAAMLICWNIYAFSIRKEIRKKVLMLDLLFLVTFLFLNTGSSLGEEFAEMVRRLQTFFAAEGQDRQKAFDLLGTSRGVLWRYGMQFIFSHPIVGLGPGNVMDAYIPYLDLPKSPHNDLILIAASMGIPAVVFYLSGLTAHLAGFFRYVKTMSVLDVTMYAAVGSYLISSFLGVSMYYTAPYYFLVLGFSYGVYRRKLHAASQY